MQKNDTSSFRKDLNDLGITLSERQLEQYVRYYELLAEWNGRMNLTAITEYDEVMKKHFTDSLSLTKVCDMSEFTSLIDVGTGAGFPGLALKIAFPGLQVTLLDSLNKRIQFLNAVTEELKLEGVETIHGRAEDYARPEKLRERFELCVSRAVANLSTLCEYCLPFVKKGGLFVAYKSGGASEEISGAEKAVSLLGGRIRERKDFCLPNSDLSRTLMVMEKVECTPRRYPRKAGLPGKEPIR